MKNSFTVIMASIGISASISFNTGAFRGTVANPISTPGCYIDLDVRPEHFPTTNPAPQQDWDEIGYYCLPISDNVTVLSGTLINSDINCYPLFETYCCFGVELVNGAYKITRIEYTEVN